MKYYFSLIIDRLQSYAPQTNVTFDSEPYIKGIRLFAHDQHLSDEYLYAVDANLFSTTSLENLPLNLLVVSQESLDLTPFACKNVICLHSQTPILEIFSLIQDALLDYQEWQIRIQNALIKGDSLKEVLEIVSEKIDNPLAVFDRSMSLIHWAGDFVEDSDGTIWEEVLGKGYSLDFYTHQEWQAISRHMTAHNSPLIFKAAGDHQHTILACPIKDGAKILGSIGAVSINAPFSDAQIRLFYFLKETLEFAIKHSFSLNHLSTDASYYIDALIEGRDVAKIRVNQYLKRMGWHSEGAYCLLNFPIDEKAHDDENMVILYKRVIKQAFPNAISCLYDTNILVIYQPHITHQPYNRFYKRLDALYKKHKLQCGISELFYNIQHLHVAFAQTQKALEIGLEKHPKRSNYLFHDYYFYHLINTINQNDLALTYCHPKILEHLNSPSDSHKLLIETLYTFLIHGRNITTTADALHIHRNTLYYRLNKLSTMLDLDLDLLETNEIFYLIISCSLFLVTIEEKAHGSDD